MSKFIKFGNSKISYNTLIFNIGSATDCISAKLGLCKVGDSCYALMDEIRFKKPLDYRRKQAKFWNDNSAQDIAKYFLVAIEFEKPDTKYIRFNEAGDFAHQYDVEKMYKVAELVYNAIGVKSYVYTARKDLKFKTNHKALTVNGSGFMVDNEFSVRPFGENLDTNDFKAKCIGNCRKCNLCTKSLGIKIMVEPHGTRKNKLSKQLSNN